MKLFMITFATMFAFGLPIGLIIFWKNKTKLDIKPFIIGALCFLLFAMFLEQGLHVVCILLDNSVSRIINNNPIFYMLYGGIAAGIFEETGRLFAFKKILKKYYNPETSIAYGIGHGGIEIIITLGITYALYLLVLLGIKVFDSTTTKTIIDTITSIENSIIIVAIIERILALTLHIGLSVFVFKAVKDKKYIWYILAIMLHAVADMPAALYQTGKLSIAIVEVWCAIVAIISIYIGSKLYKEMQEK